MSTVGAKKNLQIIFQGCGAHDAFAWGVLDRLLEDGRFHFTSASGNSLAVLNALCLAQHEKDNTHQNAREHLRRVWQELSKNYSLFLAPQRGPLDRLMGRYSMNNAPGYMVFDYLNRLFSPYDLNPLDINPIVNSVKTLFDFKTIQQSPLKLHVGAVCVNSGKIEYFEQKKLSLHHIEAALCNPEYYQAVKISGHDHWGTHAVMNPDLRPHLESEMTDDLMIVWQMPFSHHKLPKTQREIHDRKENIQSFHALKNQLDLYQKTAMHRVHLIQDADTFDELNWSSKFNLEWEFISFLMDKGRHAADRWIKLHAKDVGQTSSLPDEFSALK